MESIDDWLQEFSENVAKFNVPDDADKSSRGAIARYLETGEVIHEGYRQHGQIAAAMQPHTRILLMHQLASTMGLKCANFLHTKRAPYEGVMPDRLQIILKQLSPWGEPLVVSKIAFDKAMDTDPGEIFKHPLAADATEEQKYKARDFETLYRASQNMHKSDNSATEANLLLLSYMMRWHMTVSPKVFRFLSDPHLAHSTPPRSHINKRSSCQRLSGG